MKEKYFLFIVLAGVLFAAGCGSTPAAPPPSPQAAATAPEWVSDLPPEDALWGIGIAKLSNESMAMSMAEARGRQSISYQLVTITRGMIVDYARNAGNDSSQVGTQLAEQVARQLTMAELTGASPIKRWKSPDGTWWYLVQYAKSAAAQVTAGIVNKEAAEYAEFNNMNAQKELDVNLAKHHEKPVPVSE
ncbi:MAG: hypothetical protein LBB78_00560 [Spirochaetaceae bacterium]|jgi:hypothetical protein|nr:hypothetical protein [Spirochaetaceae bacterium]